MLSRTANSARRQDIGVVVNASGKTPVVFVHGLWLLSSSWRPWRDPGDTELAIIPGRGHSLTIDSGWREVADTALEFVQRYLP